MCCGLRRQPVRVILLCVDVWGTMCADCDDRFTCKGALAAWEFKQAIFLRRSEQSVAELAHPGRWS
jgi:hypothetical protein